MHAMRYLLAMWMFTSTLWAGGLKLELSPAQPVAGESVEVSVTLEDLAGQVGIRKYPSSTGLQVNWQGISQQESTTIVNGKMSRQFILKWNGQATTNKGQYELTPIEMVIDGKVYTSNAVSFNIAQQQTSQFYLVQTQITPTEAVVGESITLNLDFCFADQEIATFERSLGRNYELAGKHYDAIEIPKVLEKDFHVHIAQARQAQNSTLWYGAEAGTRVIDGYPYRIHRCVLLLEPKKEGKLEIPAIQQTFYKLHFQRDIFGRVVPGRVNRPIVASSSPIYVSVIPAPLAGQPATFNGQVCRELKVDLQIEDLQKGQTVQLHAPLSLKVILTSNLPASSLQAPRWEQQKDILKDFDINSSAMVREDKERQCIFSGIIARPKNKNIKAFAPIVISWFNAETRKYEEARSEAFSLIVEAVDDQTILENQAKEVLALNNTSAQVKVSQHLHGLEINAEHLLKQSSQNLPWALVIGICGLSWILAAWICSAPLREKWQIQQQNLNRHSAKQTLQLIHKTQSPSEMMAILSRYLCSKYKVKDPHEALSAESPQAEHLKKILNSLEFAGYSNQKSQPEALHNNIKDLVEKLEGAST